jgi:hypothetical protein
VALTAFVLGLGAAGAHGASYPPGLRFQTLVTPRISLHFHQGLEPMAREAAAMAGEILERLEARYGHRVGRVHIVLADTEDDPNGFASPLPYPLIHLRAAAPSGTDDFGNYESWLRLVLTHELTHVVHLDEAGGLWRVGRKVLGRAPFLFPNAVTPTWMVEGLPTFEETEGTAFGRGRNPDSRMVLRMASIEGAFPGPDRPVAGLDRWPGGDASYLFGESFLRSLSQRFGSKVLPELGRSQAGFVPFFDDLTCRRVTGATFGVRWKEWGATSEGIFEDERSQVRARGETSSAPLTHRGILQAGPRFSPDGQWIAYTSGMLDRFREVRVMRADGTDDRRLADRNGGSGLAWTPDGAQLVFDEPEVYRIFSTFSDLRVVDVGTGRVSALTRGLRARTPDVSPDGTRVVFVRRLSDRSELFTIGLDGRGLSQLTRSVAGTQWSGPRFGPDGRRIVAARYSEGGWLDLVLVDPENGTLAPLLQDRARDVEPTWSPDGTSIVLRSDRDGISNLYAFRLEDRALLRITNVIGGAFSPSVSPDGRRVAFSGYSAAGYDIRAMALDLAAAPAAPAFEDPYPLCRPPVKPTAGPTGTYHPEQTLLPRFWTPYIASDERESRIGLVTGGADPLLRHSWALEATVGTETRGLNGRALYRYDRWWPTIAASVSDTRNIESLGGVEDSVRTREAAVSATFPLSRGYRLAQAASLAYRAKREWVEVDPDRNPLSLGGVEAAWSLATAKQYPYSISPVDGFRLRLAMLRESQQLGSDVSLSKLTGDIRGYLRLGGGGVLALRAGGGTTFGTPGFQRSFALGGFGEDGLFTLVDAHTGVLRGYPDSAFRGRRLAYANAELRVPLAHPQRGKGLFPLFVRHLHGAVFADAGNAWSGDLHASELKTGVGAALGADVNLGHGLPLTTTVGLAHGLAEKGETRAYFKLGLAF